MTNNATATIPNQQGIPAEGASAQSTAAVLSDGPVEVTPEEKPLIMGRLWHIVQETVDATML